MEIPADGRSLKGRVSAVGPAEEAGRLSRSANVMPPQRIREGKKISPLRGRRMQITSNSPSQSRFCGSAALRFVVLLVVASGCKSTRNEPQSTPATGTQRPANLGPQVVANPIATRCSNRESLISDKVIHPTPRQLRIFSLYKDQDLEKARVLIESDPGVVNVKNDNGSTPLEEIANLQELTIRVGGNGQGDAKDTSARPKFPLVAKLLIDKGADINARDDESLTPLIWAIIRGKKGLAELLIENCANVDLALEKTSVGAGEGMTPWVKGTTPLHFAADSGDSEMVKLLLASGAKANPRNARGQTPLAMAQKYRWKEFKEVAQLLIQNGAN